MAKAVYYNCNGEGTAFEVLKKNEDGTVDIGTDKGVLVVGKCQVSKEPAHGMVTIDAEAVESAPKTRKKRGENAEETQEPLKSE